MSGTWARIGPVAGSIGIIILIAVLRERSESLAAITATMPMTVALALWIMYAQGTDQSAVVDFVKSMALGLVGSLGWLLVVWVGARAGWGLGRLLAAGYGAWGLIVCVVFLLQSRLRG